MSARGLFVAGTDTGVGKTRVAAALAAAAAARGHHIAVMKPVAAGADPTPDGPRNDDALALIAASGCDAPYADVNPYCLASPVSPHIAAREAAVHIDLAVVQRAAARLAAGRDWLLVEGAGGWRAPIGAQETMADVARALGLPVLLVVGLRLGCLNHALLTHAAILADGLSFAGWIGNEIDPAMPRLQENVDYLRGRVGEPFALLRWEAPGEPVSSASRTALTTASRRLMQL
jgi:dethiobiotin synthetase